MDPLALAAQAHAALLNVAAVAAGGVLILAAALALGLFAGRAVPQPLRALVDWLVIAAVLTVAVAAALGLPLLASTGGPRDGLHAVYGVVALLALPLARILGAGPPRETDGPTADEAGEARGAPTVRSMA